jgi:hypothetical protein
VLPVVIVRDLRLDLIRGLALWLIFLDHIPSNVVSWITIRNYGFSDAAEIFVFISGYANTYFHGEVARQHGLAAAAVPVLKRAWQLYAAQILLFAIYVGVVGYIGGGHRHYADETNIAYFLQQPDVLMLQALLLKFKPVDLDPLPLYFVLMLVFPVILWLLGRLPIAILASSVVLYVVARALDWNLPAYPSGGWYFNPFAWQLLFVFGGWCAIGGGDSIGWFVRSRVAMILAGLYLLFSFVIVMSWNFPHLAALVPQWLGGALYPIDKANLDPLRVLHFLALAIVAVRLVPKDWPWLSARVLRPIILCGQHSLEVFALGVLLSFVGHFATLELSNNVAMQVLVSVGGVTTMVAMAAALSWCNSVEVPVRFVSRLSGVRRTEGRDPRQMTAQLPESAMASSPLHHLQDGNPCPP